MLPNVSQTPTESQVPMTSPRNKVVKPVKNSMSLMDGRHKALLITEDVSISQNFRQILSDDLKVFSATSVEEGISQMRRECPDLILCDFNSRLKDLIESLKQADFCDIPVLIVGNEKDRRKASSLIGQGIADVITLPIETAEARGRVENYLQISLAKRTLKDHLKGKSSSLEKLAQDATLKARELDRTNRMKDEFLAMLSHELRNPINVISGFAEVLLDNSDDAELAREAAETIYRNAQFQAKLIQDLMDVSRSMNGKMILECRPLELDFLLEEMMPAVEGAAQKKNIHVSARCDCTGLVSGDATRLTQVIWNLISNAIKFTPEGGRIELELRKNEAWVELLIRDTGIGIDPVFLPQIFEQFHQQDTTITRRFGGLGLGLTIVKNIIELHRGRVQAFSEGVGHGSTFILQLPSLPC